jgi:hypothetical protein
MDIFQRLLIYMARWSRRPPSRQLVITVCVAALLIVVIVAIERFIGWPAWMTVNRLPRHPTLR